MDLCSRTNCNQPNESAVRRTHTRIYICIKSSSIFTFPMCGGRSVAFATLQIYFQTFCARNYFFFVFFFGVRTWCAPAALVIFVVFGEWRRGMNGCSGEGWRNGLRTNSRMAHGTINNCECSDETDATLAHRGFWSCVCCKTDRTQVRQTENCILVLPFSLVFVFFSVLVKKTWCSKQKY